MIPCNEGKISHMTLTCGMLGNAKDNYINALKTFIAEMPTAKFTILTSSKGDAKELKDCVKEWAKEGSIKNPERVTLQTPTSISPYGPRIPRLVVGDK